MTFEIQADETGVATILNGEYFYGATTLSEAAKMLREYADDLEQLERDGWQFIAPADENMGLLSQAALL